MEEVLEKWNVSTVILHDVLEGLKQPKKMLPSKFFYDKRGSELFEKICELDEYYLTRTELNIMRNHIREISAKLGKNIQLIELGSGNSLKTRLLLDNISNIHSYVPVDISKSFLNEVTRKLEIEYPGLWINPLAADYTQKLQLPRIPDGVRRVFYFSGSTIGNFTRENAQEFICLIADSLDELGGLLIGFDLIKDRETLLAAYDDSEGVTAKFNKNILRRINNELGTDFDLSQFKHKAIFNKEQSRIEMHLVSLIKQAVNFTEVEIIFEQGETIHTENSHKYSLSSFRNMTKPYFKHVTTWTDPNKYFAVQFLGN